MWTAPRTWVLGELVSQTLLNTHLRDNLLFLKSDPLIGSATTPTTAEVSAGAGPLTVLTISGLAIPADVGAVYVEVWASAFGFSTPGTTGWFQARIEEATAGVLRRAGVDAQSDQRISASTPGNYHALYMRTADLAWAGTTRTLNLVIEGSATNVRIVAQPDSPTTMRVVRAY